MTYTINDVITRYIELRDEIKVIKARHSEELKPYLSALQMLEGFAFRTLTADMVTSIRGDDGTCFFVHSESYKVADPLLWHPWVRADLATRGVMYTNHVSAEALRAELDRTKDPISGAYNPPPGITVEPSTTVQFRRG